MFFYGKTCWEKLPYSKSSTSHLFLRCKSVKIMIRWSTIHHRSFSLCFNSACFALISCAQWRWRQIVRAPSPPCPSSLLTSYQVDQNFQRGSSPIRQYCSSHFRLQTLDPPTPPLCDDQENFQNSRRTEREQLRLSRVGASWWSTYGLWWEPRSGLSPRSGGSGSETSHSECI